MGPGRARSCVVYAADFARLGGEVEMLLGAGMRVLHFDVGDGHSSPR